MKTLTTGTASTTYTGVVGLVSPAAIGLLITT